MKEVLTALEGLSHRLTSLENTLDNNFDNINKTFDNIDRTFDKIFTLLYIIIGVIVFNFIYYFLKVNDFFIN